MMKLTIFLPILFTSLVSFAQSSDIESPVATLLTELKEQKPDWNAIPSEIAKKYPDLSTDSILLQVKAFYHSGKKEYAAFTKSYVEYVERFIRKKEPQKLNGSAWSVFSYSDNKHELMTAVGWMEDLFKATGNRDAKHIDTYANLFYKAGKKKRAIAEQQEALATIKVTRAVEFAVTYYKMRTGLPTWKYPVVKKPYVHNLKIWEEMKNLFPQFAAEITDSLIAVARIKSAKGLDSAVYAHSMVEYQDKYIHSGSSITLNESAWEVFLSTHNEDDLKAALIWSEKSLQDPKAKAYYYAYYDTYANILHKLNRKEEAIIAMQKTVENAPENEKKTYQETLEKIKSGKATWSN